MHIPIPRWLLIVACAGLWPSAALAADVVERAPCDISLSGVLAPGDGEAIERLVEAGGCSYTTLHLNSPGGSLGEALKIAQGLRRTTTVIDAGGQCLSACSLLFMAGRTCAGSPYFCTPTRKMHKSAALGFHAPFVQSDSSARLVPRDISFSEAVGVFAQILDTFARISAEVRQTGYDQDIVPSDLLTKMFVTPPEDFYLIETNDQFFSWDIGLVDGDAQLGGPDLTQPQVVNLCYSLVFSHMRGWSYTPYGFDDYRAGLEELGPATADFVARPIDTAFLSPEGAAAAPLEYLIRFEYLNMGPAVFGWCRVAPDTWADEGGYFSVSFLGDYGPLGPEINAEAVASGAVTAPLSFEARMHYSMGYAPGTPVRDLAAR